MSAAEPTVCFIARLDFESKPGGDTVQWHMYDRAARAAGLRTVAWFGDGPRPAADVYHAFNIDRPLELYPKLRQVKRAGRPFILSTIHHPNEWLERFRTQHPPSGFLGRLLYRSPLGRSVPASESIKEAVRLVQQRRLGRLTDLWPSWSRRVEWLMAEADCITLLSAKEGEFIARDFGYTCRPEQAAIVPNWVEGVGSPEAPVPASFRGLSAPPVIVVGRIEARKNVLRVCRLADVAGRAVFFIGRPNPNEPGYAEAMKAAIARSKNARWIPGVPRDEMAGFYAHAGFLLNASYVEVSPLVDIEALMFGCPVTTTRYALHHALLPAGTPVCDAYDDQDLLGRLTWQPPRQAPTTVVDPAAVQRDLLGIYRRLAGSAA